MAHRPHEEPDWTREAFEPEPVYNPRIDVPMRALREFPALVPIYELPAGDEGERCPLCGEPLK